MSKFLKATVLALAASAAITGSAQAANLLQGVKLTASLEPSNNYPKLEFFLKDGEYVLGKGGEQRTIKFRAKAERMNDGRIISYRVESRDSGKQIAAGGAFHAKKMDVSFTHKVRNDELNALVSTGRKVCEIHGDRDKVAKQLIKRGLRYKLVVEASAFARKATDYETSFSSVRVQVICHPEPFEVKDVDLSVKYNGSAFSCPVRATLSAKFTTNKPGKNKITFILMRDDGAKREVTVNTYGSGQQGIAKWHRKYDFSQSADRKYMIIVKGSPISTGWVPMKVSCNKGVGGYQSAPKPNAN